MQLTELLWIWRRFPQRDPWVGLKLAEFDSIQITIDKSRKISKKCLP